MSNRLLFVLCWSLSLGLWLSCGPTTPTKEKLEESAPKDAGTDRLARDNTPDTPQEAAPDTRERPTERRPEPTKETQTELPPEAPSNVRALCQKIAAATCPSLWRCCSSLKLKYDSVQDCIQKLTQSCDDLAYKKERLALADGKASIDTTQLNTCLKAIEDAGKTCGIPDAALTDRVCRGIFQDPAAVGSPCKSDLGGMHCGNNTGVCFAEPTGFPCKQWSPAGVACSKGPCEPGLYCDIDSSTTGICKAPADKDQPCKVPAHCKTGLACLNNKCTDPLDGGKPCDNVRQCKEGFACDITQKLCVPTKKVGESCRFILQCGAGHACSGLAAGTICQKGKQTGETCNHDRDCATGLGCQQGKCAPLPKEGEACSPSPGCGPGLSCDTGTSKCLKLPTKGQTCLSKKPRCAESLVCFQGSNTCEPPGQKDAPCQDGEECEPGVFGCGSSGKCEPLPTLGQPCFQGVICHKDVVCDLAKKTCVKRKTAGEECPLGFECDLSLACVADKDGKKTCTTIPKEGEPCTTRCAPDLQCRPGLVEGTCIPSICNGALR